MSIIELPDEGNMDSVKYGHLRLDKELNIVSYTDYAKEFYGSIHHLNSYEQLEKDIRALSDSDAKNMAAIEQLCNQLKSGANSLDLTIKTSLLHKDHKMQKLRGCPLLHDFCRSGYVHTIHGGGSLSKCWPHLQRTLYHC